MCICVSIYLYYHIHKWKAYIPTKTRFYWKCCKRHNHTWAIGGMDCSHVHAVDSGVSGGQSACRITFRRYAAKSALSNSDAKKSFRLAPATLHPSIFSNVPMSPDICGGNLHRPKLSTTQGRTRSKLPRRIEIIPQNGTKLPA